LLGLRQPADELLRPAVHDAAVVVIVQALQAGDFSAYSNVHFEDIDLFQFGVGESHELGHGAMAITWGIAEAAALVQDDEPGTKGRGSAQGENQDVVAKPPLGTRWPSAARGTGRTGLKPFIFAAHGGNSEPYSYEFS